MGILKVRDRKPEGGRAHNMRRVAWELLGQLHCMHTTLIVTKNPLLKAHLASIANEYLFGNDPEGVP